MKKRPFAAVLGLVLFLFPLLLSSCVKLTTQSITVTSASATNLDLCNGGENQRYSLLKIQLGGKDFLSCYKAYGNTTTIIAGYNSGVRVVNVWQFALIERNESGEKWVVVYRDTEEKVHVEDILVTSDISTTLAPSDAFIRYIIAESQERGGVEPYRKFADDPIVAFALQCWDDGIRVSNSNRYSYGVNFARAYRSSWLTMNGCSACDIRAEGIELTEPCTFFEPDIVFFSNPMD